MKLYPLSGSFFLSLFLFSLHVAHQMCGDGAHFMALCPPVMFARRRRRRGKKGGAYHLTPHTLKDLTIA